MNLVHKYRGPRTPRLEEYTRGIPLRRMVVSVAVALTTAAAGYALVQRVTPHHAAARPAVPAAT